MPICPYCKKETRFAQVSPSMFRCLECSTEYLDYYFFSLPCDVAHPSVQVKKVPEPTPPKHTTIPLPVQISLPSERSNPGLKAEPEPDVACEPASGENIPLIQVGHLEDFPPKDSKKPFLASGHSILAWYDAHFDQKGYTCLRLIADILHLDVPRLKDIIRPLEANSNRIEASLHVPRYLPTGDLTADLFQYFLTPEDIIGLPAKCHRYCSLAQGYNLIDVLRYIEKDIGLVEYHRVQFRRNKGGAFRIWPIP